MKECNLDLMIRTCDYCRDGLCRYGERCSFQKEEIIMQEHPKKVYVRPERWYAKYTMERKR